LQKRLGEKTPDGTETISGPVLLHQCEFHASPVARAWKGTKFGLGTSSGGLLNYRRKTPGTYAILPSKKPSQIVLSTEKRGWENHGIN